jgi:hypothetical protein
MGRLIERVRQNMSRVDWRVLAGGATMRRAYYALTAS